MSNSIQGFSEKIITMFSGLMDKVITFIGDHPQILLGMFFVLLIYALIDEL